MAAPNATPSNCGGVSVACCPNRLPEVLKASFSGANTCGFSADAFLAWNGSSWSGSAVGCGGGAFTNGLNCAGKLGVASSAVTGNGGKFNFGISKLGAAWCGADRFKVIFNVGQNT